MRFIFYHQLDCCNVIQFFNSCLQNQNKNKNEQIKKEYKKSH